MIVIHWSSLLRFCAKKKNCIQRVSPFWEKMIKKMPLIFVGRWSYNITRESLQLLSFSLLTFLLKRRAKPGRRILTCKQRESERQKRDQFLVHKSLQFFLLFYHPIFFLSFFLVYEIDHFRKNRGAVALN